MSSKIRGHFETLWAVKKVGFPRKDFCFTLIANSKKVGKKSKKGRQDFSKIFSNFLQIPASKNFRVPPLGKQWFFNTPTPPPFSHPPPLSVFSKSA
jgi:hypothetical protein